MIKFSKITYDVRPLLPRLGTYFESQADVAASYLFGSLTSGEQPPLSDIDIGVLLNRHVPQGSYFERRLELMRDIAGILCTDEIDLLILNELPIPIAYHAIQPRVILYERHPEVRIRFETRVIDRYLDTIPMRNVQLSYLKSQIREGSFIGER